MIDFPKNQTLFLPLHPPPLASEGYVWEFVSVQSVWLASGDKSYVWIVGTASNQSK